MSDRAYENVWAMCNNTLRILMFACIAVYSQKWWVVLFSILFLTTVRTEKVAGNQAIKED